MAISPLTKSTTIAPPVLGWNTKDPISAMDPQYALSADWYISHGSTVDLQFGCTRYTSAVGTWAKGLMGFTLQSGAAKLIAIANTGRPYSCPSGAGVDLSSAGTRLCGSFPTGVMFNNTFFFKARENSFDVLSWDGVSAAVGFPNFTGPGGDDKALFGPNAYNNRLYFCEYQSLSFWYGTDGGVTGTLTEYDLQTLCILGGELLYVGPATKAGAVNQSYFVAITSMGEVFVFQGLDPSDSTWYQVGHYFMPPPVGSRSFFYWGSNLVIITIQGLLLLNEVMSGNSNLNFLSDKINDQFQSFASSVFGAGKDTVNGTWHPKTNSLYINFPAGGGLAGICFVMSTINGSWWNIPGTSGGGSAVGARDCFGYAVADNELYFGTQGLIAGAVMLVNGYVETDGDNATKARSTKLRCAFNYLDSRETVKQPTQAIPIVYESEGLSLTLDCDIDYSDNTATSTVTDTTTTSYKLYRPTCGLSAPGPGKAISIRSDQSITTKRRSIQAIEVFWREGSIR